MGKKKAPKAPDMTQAATQDTWAQRPNQQGPWGSTTWGTESVIDPATGKPVTKWTQNTQLNPQDQAMLDQQRGIQGGLWNQAQQNMQNPMDWGGFQDWGQTPEGGNIQDQFDFSNLQDVQGSQEQRQRAEDAVYGRLQSRLDPQWREREQRMESSLGVRGAGMSSAAERARMQQGRERTDAYDTAARSAIEAGGNEMMRSFGMDMGRRQQQAAEAMAQGQFGNQAQQQRWGQNLANAQYQNQLRGLQSSEAMMRRNQPLSELAMMQGMGPSMPGMPGFGGGGGNMNAAMMNYQNQMNAVNAANAQRSGIGSAIGTIGGGIFGGPMGAMVGGSLGGMFSDRRTKQVGERVGTHPRGFGIYKFRYIGESGWREGPVAQEVQQFAPDLVGDLSGVLTVNYEGF